MSSITELFNLFDTDQDGFIDMISYKRILNILEYSLNTIDDTQLLFSYDDLINYIIKYNKVTQINKNELKNELLNQYNSVDTNFILDNVCNANSKNNKIDVEKLMKFNDTFLKE